MTGSLTYTYLETLNLVCRYPGTTDDFWQILRDASSQISRYEIKGFEIKSRQPTSQTFSIYKSSMTVNNRHWPPMTANDRQSESFLNLSRTAVSEPLTISKSFRIIQRIDLNKSQLLKLKSEKIMKFRIFVNFFDFEVRRQSDFFLNLSHTAVSELLNTIYSFRIVHRIVLH